MSKEFLKEKFESLLLQIFNIGVRIVRTQDIERAILENLSFSDAVLRALSSTEGSFSSGLGDLGSFLLLIFRWYKSGATKDNLILTLEHSYPYSSPVAERLRKILLELKTITSSDTEEEERMYRDFLKELNQNQRWLENFREELQKELCSRKDLTEQRNLIENQGVTLMRAIEEISQKIESPSTSCAKLENRVKDLDELFRDFLRKRNNEYTEFQTHRDQTVAINEFLRKNLNNFMLSTENLLEEVVKGIGQGGVLMKRIDKGFEETGERIDGLKDLILKIEKKLEDLEVGGKEWQVTIQRSIQEIRLTLSLLGGKGEEEMESEEIYQEESPSISRGESPGYRPPRGGPRGGEGGASAKAPKTDDDDDEDDNDDYFPRGRMGEIIEPPEEWNTINDVAQKLKIIENDLVNIALKINETRDYSPKLEEINRRLINILETQELVPQIKHIENLEKRLDQIEKRTEEEVIQREMRKQILETKPPSSETVPNVVLAEINILKKYVETKLLGAEKILPAVSAMAQSQSANFAKLFSELETDRTRMKNRMDTLIELVKTRFEKIETQTQSFSDNISTNMNDQNETLKKKLDELSILVDETRSSLEKSLGEKISADTFGTSEIFQNLSFQLKNELKKIGQDLLEETDKDIKRRQEFLNEETELRRKLLEGHQRGVSKTIEEILAQVLSTENLREISRQVLERSLGGIPPTGVISTGFVKGELEEMIGKVVVSVKQEHETLLRILVQQLTPILEKLASHQLTPEGVSGMIQDSLEKLNISYHLGNAVSQSVENSLKGYDFQALLNAFNAKVDDIIRFIPPGERLDEILRNGEELQRTLNELRSSYDPSFVQSLLTNLQVNIPLFNEVVRSLEGKFGNFYRLWSTFPYREIFGDIHEYLNFLLSLFNTLGDACPNLSRAITVNRLKALLSFDGDLFGQLTQEFHRFVRKTPCIPSLIRDKIFEIEAILQSGTSDITSFRTKVADIQKTEEEFFPPMVQAAEATQWTPVVPQTHLRRQEEMQPIQIVQPSPKSSVLPETEPLSSPHTSPRLSKKAKVGPFTGTLKKTIKPTKKPPSASTSGSKKKFEGIRSEFKKIKSQPAAEFTKLLVKSKEELIQSLKEILDSSEPAELDLLRLELMRTSITPLASRPNLNSTYNIATELFINLEGRSLRRGIEWYRSLTAEIPALERELSKALTEYMRLRLERATIEEKKEIIRLEKASRVAGVVSKINLNLESLSQLNKAVADFHGLETLNMNENILRPELSAVILSGENSFKMEQFLNEVGNVISRSDPDSVKEFVQESGEFLTTLKTLYG